MSPIQQSLSSGFVDPIFKTLTLGFYSNHTSPAMANYIWSLAYLLACMTALAFTAPMPNGDPLWGNSLDDGSTGDDYERLVDAQIHDNAVMMYTGSRCGLSRMAKDLLDTKYPNIRYKYLDYDISPGGDFIMGPVSKRSHTSKLPQIFICGSYIGGRGALFRYHQSGQLESMIRRCS